MAIDFGNFDLSGVEAPPTLDTGGFGLGLPTDFGTLNLPSNLGGGGWGNILSNIGTGITAGKDLIGTGLNIKSQLDNARYQKQLQDYYKQRSQSEAAYNAAVLKWQQDREAWQQQMTGMFTDFFNQFQGGVQDFQSQVGGILQQQASAAMDQLAKANQLQEPAIAALARGEVPKSLEPMLDQFKARARAAAMQNFAAQGIDVGTGEAAITQQIDQSAMVALQQWAQTMLQSSGGLTSAGAGLLSAETGTAQAMLDPIAREFAALQQAITGLAGSGGGLAGGTPPPPPVA